MGILEHLEPKKVFQFFEELCAIPHGSSDTKAVSDWCVEFARARGLKYLQDEMNNVIIWKAGTPGYENAPGVILQGHMDMVCEKEVSCAKDMEKEGLDLLVDGDFVRAKGTTLGGDDGIAIAMAMAVLDAGDIPHPPLEAVFTVDEEIGMLGAVGIDASPLQGRWMVNLDSEAEGVFTVSCAGGNVSKCILPVKREAYAGTGLAVTVDGLRGGHSGAEIDKGRGNSSILMGRVLRALLKAGGLRLVSVAGGLKDNAIPVETAAYLVTADAAALTSAAAEAEAALKNEYRATDPDIRVEVKPWAAEGVPMDEASTARTIAMLRVLPNGIQFMSGEIPGLVQTSLNLGILKTQEACVEASFCVRSAVETQKAEVKDRLACLMEQLGGTVEYSGDYPGWEYRKDSALRELMVEIFREQYGHDPRIEAIHAGVECGMFIGKLPGLDCVSVGPDLLEIHTPRERMSISSVQRVWKFLLEILKRSK